LGQVVCACDSTIAVVAAVDQLKINLKENNINHLVQHLNFALS